MDNPDGVLLALLVALGTFHSLKSFVDMFIQNFLPHIELAQKPYLDRFVAYQKLEQIPNPMQGFNLNDLANGKTEEGWIDPISLDAIPPDQISGSAILRFGSYAIPIKTALVLMLTRIYKSEHCPLGEIPHPIEGRNLSPDEKTKFLLETSAFFGISSRTLESCWKASVTPQDVDPLTSKIDNWNDLPRMIQIPVYDEIAAQLLPIKRKQAFLSLLTVSIAQTYFDDDFRSDAVKIPNIQIPQQPNASILQTLLRAVIARQLLAILENSLNNPRV